MNVKEALATLLVSKDPKVLEAANILRDGHERRTRVLDLVQEALSQLRLDMKYLIFDLEATRRERDKARGIA
jgi:hypothetical protein